MLNSQYDMVKFGNQIKDIRNRQNLSLQKLSEISGLSLKTIHKIEKGNLFCTMETLSILSFHLKTDLLDILSNQKNIFLSELIQLKSHIDIDLSQRNYEYFDSYIKTLNSYYDKIKYNPSDIKHVEYFNYIDKMILWIKGMKKFTLKNYTLAETLFIKALSISFNNFSFKKLDNYHLTGVDLNIFNSVIITRMESENFEDIDYYIDFLKDEILKAPSHPHDLYIRLNFNTSTLYFHREEFNKSIRLVDETIRYMKKYNIKTDLSTLILTKAGSATIN